MADDRRAAPADGMTAADRTLRNLTWLNFAIAGMQAGFGPFVSVRLTASGWNPAAIGIVLSAGSVASVLAQVPSGIIIDQFGARRGLASTAVVASMAALFMLSLVPGFALVLAAEIVQGGAGVGLSLAVAAITLCVSRQAHLGERLGRNVRAAAIGAAGGSALLGAVGSWLSPSAAFVLAAAFGLPALLALRGIAVGDIVTADRRTGHHTAPPPHARRSRPVPAHRLLRDRGMQGLLAVAALFQLANASLLPLAATAYTHEAGSRAGLITAAAVIGPQLLAAALSPYIGRAANMHGRRPVLMLGLAAVPLRAVGFAIHAAIGPMLALQLLDGVSAATIGVLVPLIAADVTHRSGRFNFALGTAGLAGALGASLGTTLSGGIAVHAGLPVAFLSLAVAGLGAILVAWAWLPETAHLPASLPAASEGGVVA